ncbi:MAG: putative SOS response-associated peptidase [Prokaryotic dsDNA virus sp.]|nr:MAG: putative SOS response-associated peptidase [Prokaryotic dsDNA virus sp.]|tara:strand:+ start:11120 stop:11824 length:705 start_codon:yes stop_codon:yes gene_type:complete
MCGRYSHNLTWSEIHELAGLAFPVPDKEPVPNYNTAPTHFCPIVLSDGETCRGEFAFWGLVPHWWHQDLSEKKFTTINAKSEEITAKATYRDAVRHQRCIVPAVCFYEWRKSDKQPFAIGLGDGHEGFRPFLMAGIWSHWTGHFKNEPFDAITFTVLTREAGDKMATVHTREPAILTEDEIRPWLFDPLDDILPKVMQATPSQLLHLYPVDRAVGKVSNTGPDLMKPSGQESLF